MVRRVVLIALVCLIGGVAAVSQEGARAPTVTLWAWERPDDLRFLEDPSVRIAYLARTLRIHADGVSALRRSHSLRTPEAQQLVPVVRIESRDASIHAGTEGAILDHLTDVASRPRTSMLQIDFDARRSELPMYRNLLLALRGRVPSTVRISITALVSWCVHEGDWLEGLPVDEVVPMYFRMGREPTGGETENSRVSPRCRGVVGVSLDELNHGVQADRFYIFNPKAWTSSSYAQAVAFASTMGPGGYSVRAKPASTRDDVR